MKQNKKSEDSRSHNYTLLLYNEWEDIDYILETLNNLSDYHSYITHNQDIQGITDNGEIEYKKTHDRLPKPVNRTVDFRLVVRNSTKW